MDNNNIPQEEDPFKISEVEHEEPTSPPAFRPTPIPTIATVAEAIAAQEPVLTPDMAQPKEPEGPPVDPRDPFRAIVDSLASGEPTSARIDRPMVSDKQTPAVESLRMPSADINQNTDLLSRFPNMTKSASEEDKEWLSTFIDGLRMVSANRQYLQALQREGSDWRQGLFDNGDVIRSQIPRIAQPRGESLTGSAAIRHAVSFLGLGDTFTAAMWNSGFWVTFTPMPEVAWLELYRLLGAEEVRLGRATYGLAHSGATQLAQETIVNYILQFVYSTSVKSNEMPVADIPKYLSVHDINSFLWGFVSANFPHGFTIERSCVVDPTQCRNKAEETLELPELQVVDNSVLDTAARAHMRKRQQGSVPLQAVLEYQERLVLNTPSVVEVQTGSGKVLKMKLAPPSALHAFDMSHAHVDMVTTAVQKTVTQDTSLRERHMALNDYFTATEMRIYSHWVQSIELGQDNVVEGEEDIQKLLATFTKDSVMRMSYLDEISKYIDKSVASIIALSPMHCKKCGANHSRGSAHNSELQDVIPFDITHVFSLLAEFKARMIRARSE